MKKPLDIQLVVTGAAPSTMLVVARVGSPAAPIDPRAIVGSVEAGAAGPDWPTFQNNPPFSELVVAYMKGNAGPAPDALRGERVEAGERFFVVDGRAGTDDVPPHDVVGAYETDAFGAPIGATFRLNPNYRFMDARGRASSLFEEEGLAAALGSLG